MEGGGPQQMSMRVRRWKKKLSSNSCELRVRKPIVMLCGLALHVPDALRRRAKFFEAAIPLKNIQNCGKEIFFQPA
jgi:hypothetical protein